MLVFRSARRNRFVSFADSVRAASVVMLVRVLLKRSAMEIRRVPTSWVFWIALMKRVGQCGQDRASEAVLIASRRGWRAMGNAKEGSIDERLLRVR